MAIIRWTPWQELENIQHHLNRVLQDSDIAPRSERQWAPAVDIRETADAILVDAELPGLEKQDVQVELKEGVLSISGERKTVKEVDEETVHRVERSYGRFVRSFVLPSNVDGGKVEARMENGVLHIRLQKHEAAKPRSIEIH